MRRSSHHLRFLVLIAIFFAVKIVFSVIHIHQLNRQLAQWTELEKQTRKTCEKSVQLCEQMTGKPCGSCN